EECDQWVNVLNENIFYSNHEAFHMRQHLQQTQYGVLHAVTNAIGSSFNTGMNAIGTSFNAIGQGLNALGSGITGVLNQGPNGSPRPEKYPSESSIVLPVVEEKKEMTTFSPPPSRRSKQGSIDSEKDVNTVYVRRASKARLTVEGLLYSCKVQPLPYFGVPLDVIVEREGSEVPALVELAIKYITDKALKEEGILRLSGSLAEVNAIRSQIERDGIINFHGQDPHVVANVLKAFLRELPEPLIPTEINSGIIAILNYGEGAEVLAEMKNIFELLSPTSMKLLKRLIDFMMLVAAQSDLNKMNTSNLMIVMTPALKIAPGIFSIPMSNYDYFFGSNQSPPNTPSPPPSTAPSTTTENTTETKAAVVHDVHPSESARRRQRDFIGNRRGLKPRAPSKMKMDLKVVPSTPGEKEDVTKLKQSAIMEQELQEEEAEEDQKAIEEGGMSDSELMNEGGEEEKKKEEEKREGDKANIPLGIVAAPELNLEMYAQGQESCASPYSQTEIKAQGARADRMLLKSSGVRLGTKTSQLILYLSEGTYLINDTFNYVGSNTKDLVIVGVGPSTIIIGGSNFSINNVTRISTAVGDENSLFYLHDTSLSLSNIHFTGTHSCTLYIYCPEFCIVEGSQLYSNSSITSFNKAEIFTDYHVNVTLSQVYGTQNGTFFRATSAGDITITDSSSYNNDNMNSRYGAILLSRCEYGIFTIQSCNFSGSNFAAISFEGGNAHGAPIAAIISNSNFESMWGGFNGVIYINDPLAFSATIRNSHFHNINKSSVDGVNQYSCIICYFGQRSNLLIENSTFTNNTANDAIVSSFINPNTESIRYYPNATYRNLIIKDNHSPFVTETIVFASTLMENVSITFPSDLKTVQCGALNVTQTLYNFTADLRLTNVDIENGKTDAWCVDGTYRDVTAQNVTMAVGDQGRFLNVVRTASISSLHLSGSVLVQGKVVTVVMENLYMRNLTSLGDGGAISLTASSVVDQLIIRGVTAVNCTAQSGGFISLSHNGNFTEISNVTAETCGATSGGVIDLQMSLHDAFIHNVSVRNSHANYGGFLTMEPSSIITGTFSMNDIRVASTSSKSHGGVMYVQGYTSELNLTDIHVTNIRTGGMGGMYLSSFTGRTLNVNRVNVSSSSAGSGAAFVVDGSWSTIAMRNCGMLNLSVNGQGGAISVSSTTDNFQFSDSNFDLCTSAMQGGVLSLSTAAVVEDIQISDVTVSRGQGLFGGGSALYISAPNIKMYIRQSNVTNGKADDSGAIYVEYAAHVDISELISSNNTANSYGGMLFSLGSPYVSLRNCNFSNDRATVYGGSIFITPRSIYNATVVLQNNVFRGNSAMVRGGAIYVSEDSVVYGQAQDNQVEISMENCTFIDNTAETMGGAMYVHSSTFYAAGGKFANNSAIYGGGVYSENIQDLSFYGTIFQENSASYSGASIYLSEGNATSLSNCTFYGETAPNGASLYTTGGTLHLNTLGNMWTRNQATHGSVVEIHGNCRLTMSRDVITENSGNYGVFSLMKDSSFCLNVNDILAGNNFALYNGSVFTLSGISMDEVNISGSTFRGNSATNGGALYVAYAGSHGMNLRNNLFQSSSASLLGGAVYVEDIIFSVYNDTYLMNHASFGGAIMTRESVTRRRQSVHGDHVQDTSFVQNTADYGGAMNVLGRFNLLHVTLRDNVASASGGGIYLQQASRLDVRSSSFDGKDDAFLSDGSTLTTDASIPTSCIPGFRSHTSSNVSVVSSLTPPTDNTTSCIPAVVEIAQPVNDKRPLTYGLIAGGCVVILIALILIFAFLVTRRARRRRYMAAEMERLNVSDLMLEDIAFEEILGTGAFGEVYKGKWHETVVALKGLKNVSMAGREQYKTEEGKWREEIVLLKRMNHPNVVRLLGVTTNDSSLFMVLEYVENGALDSYLRARQRSLNDNDLIAMVVLLIYSVPSQSVGIIHRDLAARNILVDKSMNLKISDFGMSREDTHYEASSKLLPYRWAAPEMIHHQISSYERRYSLLEDVRRSLIAHWLTFTVPYFELSSNLDVIHFVVEQRQKLSRPFRCWEYETKDRPNFKEIHSSMKNMYNELSGSYIDVPQVEVVITKKSPLLQGSPKSPKDKVRESIYNFPPNLKHWPQSQAIPKALVQKDCSDNQYQCE
ncbi:TXK tyrosine kinase, partial [Planoprotostelium fungivorum]